MSGIELDEVPPADCIDFDNTGLKFNSILVSTALDELRNREVHSLHMHTTTLNGSDTIIQADDTIHIAEGTATGYKFVMPDATTLFLGRRFEMINSSSETILINDDGGTTLVTLIAGDSAVLTLEDNATANGSWIVTVVSLAATGITSYVVTSNTPFITSSSTDDLITGFTITPVSGRYSVWYSADIVISNNNRESESVIYVDAVAIENTRRTTQGVGSNYEAAANTVGEVIVDGTEAVDVRVNITAGDLDVNQRSLVLIRLGS